MFVIRRRGRRRKTTLDFSRFLFSFFRADADMERSSHQICWQSTNMIIKPFITVLNALGDFQCDADMSLNRK